MRGPINSHNKWSNFVLVSLWSLTVRVRSPSGPLATPFSFFTPPTFAVLTPHPRMLIICSLIFCHGLSPDMKRTGQTTKSSSCPHPPHPPPIGYFGVLSSLLSTWGTGDGPFTGSSFHRIYFFEIRILSGQISTFTSK